MLEHEILFTASAAMLCLLLLYHIPPMRWQLGRWGFLLALAGTLVPLLDLPLRYLQANDRIALLAGDALFYSLYPVALLMGALLILVAAMTGWAMALRALGAVMLGYALHLALVLTTPVGVYLFWPFHELRVALPIFPAGHVAMVGVLGAALLAGELWPRVQQRFMVAAGILLVAYATFAGGQLFMIRLQAATFAPEDEPAVVEPVDALMTEWVVIKEGPAGYQIWRWQTFRNFVSRSEIVPRATDAGTLVWMMADPIVRRIYFRLFRHPVARLEQSNSQLTLLVQELADIPTDAGRILHVEMDRSGGRRFYELEHFD